MHNSLLAHKKHNSAQCTFGSFPYTELYCQINSGMKKIEDSVKPTTKEHNLQRCICPGGRHEGAWESGDIISMNS